MPIVEPDISLVGDYDLETAVRINVEVQAELYKAMIDHGVYMARRSAPHVPRAHAQSYARVDTRPARTRTDTRARTHTHIHTNAGVFARAHPQMQIAIKVCASAPPSSRSPRTPAFTRTRCDVIETNAALHHVMQYHRRRARRSSLI
jgi:hypothetical protein